MIDPISDAAWTVPDLALVQTQERRFYVTYVKPAIDRIGALVLIVMLAPLLLAVFVAVYVKLGAPTLLRQERIGRNGRPFPVLKFRTMLPDRRVASIARWDGVDRRQNHKSDDDPRHTPLGRVLRRWSLDELPQLFNVLKGDMSLVGPRPELRSVVERTYEPWQHARHQVRPGLTGLWQVTARDSIPLHEATALDLEYIRELSFGQDMTLLMRTAKVLAGRQQGR